MTRSQIINSLISKYKYTDYLEIGVNTPAQPGWNYDSVKVKNKDGVDPNPETSANYVITSDDFFANHINKKYDIIFVDGLHIFEQAHRDIVNSLNHLKENGTIVVHDCNPKSEITQRRDRASSVWLGDVWKAILKLRIENPNIEISTVNTDYGCAIIRKGNQELLKANQNKDIYNYKFFKKNRREILNLISVKEFKNIINSKIIVKLKGGLGNQMFQYAFARRISEKNKTEIKFDISEYLSKQRINRHYCLSVFNIKEEKEIKKIEYKNKNAIFKIIRKLVTKIKYKKRYINDSSNLDKIDTTKKDSYYLDGYFQSEKYFKPIENIIRNEFTIKNELLSDRLKDAKENISNNNSVSIHVRRSDYIDDKKINKYHGALTKEYYKNAIEIINKKIQNPSFYIFSDDIKWCKENLNDLANDITFIENLKDFEDLELIKTCKHNIIANSSFSWWGAWLNNNPNKIVIAPKNWFANKNKNSNDLVSKTWIKI